jgi:hypothetical protein
VDTVPFYMHDHTGPKVERASDLLCYHASGERERFSSLALGRDACACRASAALLCCET